MFKTANLRILIILLLALVVIFLITLMTRKEDRSFKKELVSFSPDEVTEILFNPDPAKDEKIRLLREQHGVWKVYSESIAYNADTSLISGMIRSIVNLQPERVAATDRSRWSEFQVDDSTGIRVEILGGKEVLADLIVGKFSYKPQQGQQAMYGQDRGKMSSYVRVAGEEEVYAVDGFLRMTFQANVSNLRNKALSATRRDDISRIVFTGPDDDSFVLEKQGERFLMEGVMTDSAETVRYLADIARMTSQDFVYDVTTGNTPDYSVRIESNNTVPIEIKAFVADTVHKYILTSTVNPGTYFSGYGKNKLFERIFMAKEKFAPKMKEAMQADE